MDKTDLAYAPASELVDLIASKALSPVELMEATLARLDDLNPKLNAVCTPTPELAMEGARKAEQAVMNGDALGPLHGVPTTIKDLTSTKGIRTMSGSHVDAHRVPDEDAPFVERLAAAGAISMGKTTTPEFGWMGCGKSPITGVSHNPWKHGYNAGGSSAGAAIITTASHDMSRLVTRSLPAIGRSLPRCRNAAVSPRSASLGQRSRETRRGPASRC